jgi:hypothetical protein
LALMAMLTRVLHWVPVTCNCAPMRLAVTTGTLAGVAVPVRVGRGVLLASGMGVGDAASVVVGSTVGVAVWVGSGVAVGG